MAIDESVILKLEKLAKLKLDDVERKSIAEDLDKILKMVDKLQEVDTSGVEPLIYMHEEINVLRIDEVSDMLDTEKGLANAPKRVKNYFAVPKIIQQ